MATNEEADRRQSTAGIALAGFVGFSALMVAIGVLVVAVSDRNHDAGSGFAVEPVSLTEYQIWVPHTLPAGNYSFQFTNNGTTAHEVLVFATDLLPGQFPRNPDGTVNEEGPGMNKVSDGDNIDPGGTQSRAVDLTKRGHYVFLCNLAGHYAAGMYTVVFVT